jgi:NhaP-type Na+/H+ or K+/H+ antiporter
MEEVSTLMTYSDLAVLALFIFAYSIVAGRVERMLISGPIVFILFGLVCGPLGLGLLTFQVGGESLRTLAELTLAMVLFTGAAGIDLRVLMKSHQISLRLLLVGLPLTILLGFAVGRFVFPGLMLFEVAILATMLAPTDAALGSAVVTNDKVPAHIRRSLNVESGLNDGICVPILFVFLALATGTTAASGEFALAESLALQEIGIGLGVGLLLTVFGSWATKLCYARGWITSPWKEMVVVGLAFSCFAVAQMLGGSGFIASFVGGLLFGAAARNEKAALLRTGEGIGEALALATWVAFGSVVFVQMGGFDWRILGYALLSLTVVRMLPVFVALMGSGLRTYEKMFIGWFGPRGLASIVFIIIVLEEKLPGHHTLKSVVATTVLLSVLLHGLSANPLVAALAAKVATRGDTRGDTMADRTPPGL